MDLNDRQRVFVTWLNRLEEETGRLHALLERESRVLRERKMDLLQELVGEKNERVERIEALLAQAPVQAGAEEGRVEGLICDLKLQDTPVAGKWRRLRRRMEECRMLNEANGATIALLQEHNNRALVLLFGQRRDRVCYGADGRGLSDGGERLLVTT